VCVCERERKRVKEKARKRVFVWVRESERLSGRSILSEDWKKNEKKSLNVRNIVNSSSANGICLMPSKKS